MEKLVPEYRNGSINGDVLKRNPFYIRSRNIKISKGAKAILTLIKKFFTEAKLDDPVVQKDLGLDAFPIIKAAPAPEKAADSKAKATDAKATTNDPSSSISDEFPLLKVVVTKSHEERVKALMRAGMSGKIATVSKRLSNTRNLDNTTQQLLSIEEAYSAVLYRTIIDLEIKDTEGIHSQVLIEIEFARKLFYASLTRWVIKYIKREITKGQLEQVSVKSFRRNVPVLEGETIPCYRQLIKEVEEYSPLEDLVKYYLLRQEVDVTKNWS